MANQNWERVRLAYAVSLLGLSGLVVPYSYLTINNTPNASRRSAPWGLLANLANVVIAAVRRTVEPGSIPGVGTKQSQQVSV